MVGRGGIYEGRHGDGKPVGSAPERDTGISDEVLRELWRLAGGAFHGPNIEHGLMPEAKLLPFLRTLLDRSETTATVLRKYKRDP